MGSSRLKTSILAFSASRLRTQSSKRAARSAAVGAAARSESVTARAASARRWWRWWWSSFRAIIAAAGPASAPSVPATSGKARGWGRCSLLARCWWGSLLGLYREEEEEEDEEPEGRRVILGWKLAGTGGRCVWRAGVGRSFARGGRGRKDAACCGERVECRGGVSSRNSEEASRDRFPCRLRCPDSGPGISTLSLSLPSLRLGPSALQQLCIRKSDLCPV